MSDDPNKANSPLVLLLVVLFVVCFVVMLSTTNSVRTSAWPNSPSAQKKGRPEATSERPDRKRSLRIPQLTVTHFNIDQLRLAHAGGPEPNPREEFRQWKLAFALIQEHTPCAHVKRHARG
jgi:hypothetical protein